MRHSSHKYRDVHSQLNNHYGEDIYDIDSFFNADRTAVADGINVNAKVTELVASAMCANGADSTKLSSFFTDGLLLLK